MEENIYMLLLIEVNLSKQKAGKIVQTTEKKLSIRSVCFVLPIDIHNIHNTKVSTWFFFDEVTENMHLVLKKTLTRKRGRPYCVSLGAVSVLIFFALSGRNL